jgi:hypothetical protein
MNSYSTPSDVWPVEKQGYEKPVPVAYAPLHVPPSPKSKFPVAWEERLASLMAGAGVIWGVQVLTSPIARVSKLMGTAGPLELCAIAVLIWIHAKWRRSLA